MHQGNIFYRRLAKTRLPERCGWSMRADYLNNSVRRYGQVFVARGVIWWPSRWRRTVAIHWQRHCVDRRVSRIAVHPARQREGTGQQLIAGALQYTRDLDYLSVSFGYTGELWRFWHRCGFVLVRMGNHREASSGCYTAMALLWMSNAGKQLAEREHYRLRRDAQALAKWNGETFLLIH